MSSSTTTTTTTTTTKKSRKHYDPSKEEEEWREPSDTGPKPREYPNCLHLLTLLCYFTYTDMIDEALRALGGQGTAPDIIKYMEEHHQQFLATKTNTWRNSVCGTLSGHAHFPRLGKSSRGLIVWGTRPLNGTDFKPAPSLNKVEEATGSTSPVIPPQFKAPARSTQSGRKLFDLHILEQLAKKNPTPNETTGITMIDETHPLQAMNQVLMHPGPVFSLSWSSDGTLLATANAAGTIRIWETSAWKLMTEFGADQRV